MPLTTCFLYLNRYNIDLFIGKSVLSRLVNRNIIWSVAARAMFIQRDGPSRISYRVTAKYG